MDNFKQRIRTFDAFPKTASTHEVRSQRGGLSSILMGIAALFILYVEIGGYIDGEINRTFEVDQDVLEQVMVNLDMLVAMPCLSLNLNVMDATMDRLFADELLNMEGMPHFLPPTIAHAFRTQNEVSGSVEIDEAIRKGARAMFGVEGQRANLDLPACHIFGLFPITKVKGQFHVTARGHAFMGGLPVKEDTLNFTHAIAEFSFGEFFPLYDNTLDRTYQETDSRLLHFRYHLTAVPVLYRKLGLAIDTYQYLLMMNKIEALSMFGSPKGILFAYDFDPIRLKVSEHRLLFVLFVFRVLTIVCGWALIAMWLYLFAELVLEVWFGRRYASRGVEKSRSLLGDTE